MIIYTNVFTIQGQSPSENRYIDMFFIWYRFIQKNGNLSEKDMIFLMTDSTTAEYIEDKMSNSFTFSILEYPQPKTYLEGILRRYTAPFYLEKYKDEQFLYFDVDILCISSLHDIEQLGKNQLYIFPENNLLDQYYLGALLSETEKEEYMKKLGDFPGFTGGCFSYRGELLNIFFTELVKFVKEGRRDLEMYEQPYWCKIIYRCLFENKIEGLEIKIADSKRMEHNSSIQKCKKETVFLNFCGEPGDGTHHWRKIFFALLSTV